MRRPGTHCALGLEALAGDDEPKLVEVSAERVAQVVDEAVRTIAARYAETGPGPPTND